LVPPRFTYSGTIRQLGKRRGPSGKSAVESRTIAVFSAVRFTQRPPGSPRRSRRGVRLLSPRPPRRPRARAPAPPPAPRPWGDPPLALLRGHRGREAPRRAFGRGFEHRRGRLRPVETGHAVVHEHGVGREPAAELDRLGAAFDRADHLDLVA